MKAYLVAILPALASMVSCSEKPAVSKAYDLAVTSINMIDVEAGVVDEKKTILIKGRSIAAVVADIDFEPATSTKIIDGDGKFAIPGLWDMHSHISSDSITREIVLPLYIANGVTGIRVMNGDCVDGQDDCSNYLVMSAPQIQKMRADVDAGLLKAPTIVAAGHQIDGPGLSKPSSVTRPRTAEEGRELAHYLKARGVDFGKPYDMLSRDAYFALADEASQIGLPIAGHVPVAVRASEASDAGQKSIEHCCAGSLIEECSSEEELLRPQLVEALFSDAPNAIPLLNRFVATHDPEKCDAVIDKFASNGTWFTPTMVTGKIIENRDSLSSEAMSYLPREEREYQEKLLEGTSEVWGEDPDALQEYQRLRQQLMRKMKAAGVRMLTGCDPGNVGLLWGFCLQEELDALVAAGFSPSEVLRASTIGPASYFGWENETGSITAGKTADIVILDANPLENIDNTKTIFSVILRGDYLSRQDLDQMLDDVAAAAQKL